MTTTRRILTALATTALLVVGSAALAAPAQADVHAHVLGDLVGADSNGTITVSIAGLNVASVPNLLGL